MPRTTSPHKVKHWKVFRIILALLYTVCLFLIFVPIWEAIKQYQAQPHRLQMACARNYDQLGLALIQYSQDNDGYMPPVSDAKSGRTWREALYPFVKSKAIYQCPEDRRDYSHTSPNKLPFSYGASVVGNGRGAFAAPGAVPVRLEEANGNTIAVVDMRGFEGGEWDITNPAFQPKSWRELYTHKPYKAFFEHPTGTYNCFFTDGHAKFLKPMDTLTPVNLWTRDNSPFTGQELSNAQAILQHAEDE